MMVVVRFLHFIVDECSYVPPNYETFKITMQCKNPADNHHLNNHCHRILENFYSMQIRFLYQMYVRGLEF